MRKLILFSVLCAILTGAAVAALSQGAFLNGWLAAGALSFAAIFLLGLSWRWAGGGRALAVLLALSFALRLGLGMAMSLGVQSYGYDEIVQRSGYVYADAFSRDQDAWTLAASDRPIWSSFQQDFLSDQYGGSLALSALVYRALSPDAHRRFLILLLTAFAFSAGLPFFWQAVKRRWNEPTARLAAWILVLYPESILVGASQMREPFMLGLTLLAFWAVFAWRSQPRRAMAVFLAAALAMLAFSSRAAVIVVGALLVCAWFEYLDDLPSLRWKRLGWAVMGLCSLALVALSWNWLKLASGYDAGLAVRQSGMVQNILANLPQSLHLPFITGYGLMQPVLPAVLVDSAPLVWKLIGVLRAAGWYLLAPFLLYAALAAWRARPAKERRLLLWLAGSALLWLLLSSARAGGDQWDNPRYRVLFLPMMAVVTAWGWRWSRQQRDAWVWAWVGADFVFVTFFLSWYIGRYTGAENKLSFWQVVALVLPAGLLVFAAGWLVSLKREGASLRGALRARGQAARQFLALRPGRAAGSSPPARLNRCDGLAVVFFILFAVLYFLGRLQSNYPVIILSGDAGNIASFAAAQAHPELFAGDAVLGAGNLTGFYANLDIPLIRALAPLAGGDFAWAYTWLLAPHVFFQLLGFYIFGRVLLGSRFWAFLLALLTAMPFLNVGLGEFWGIWRDAIPRVTFQTVLPYLLTLAVVWRHQPRRWPWLMVLAGLMVFLHSVSTPAVGLAIWLGLWVVHPRDWRFAKRLGVMLGLGLLFLLALSPFAINFLSYQARGASPDVAMVVAVIRTYLPANLLDAPAALSLFLAAATRSLLLPLALLGGAVLLRFGRVERRLIGMVLLWAGGIFIAAVLLPVGERQVEAALQIAPIDTELARAMRYFVPLMLLFWLWPLAELTPRLANPQARRAALLLGILLLGGWTITHTPEGRRMVEASLCLARGRLVCGETRDSTGLIHALRVQTPPGARIFSFNQSDSTTSNMLSIRYAALRPLVYTVRDAGLLIYANRPAFTAWLATTRQVDAIQADDDAQTRLAALVPLAHSLDADYLVVDFPVTPDQISAARLNLIWQNDTYSLMRLP